MKIKNTAIINLLHYALCWLLVIPIIYILVELNIDAEVSLFIADAIGIILCILITTIYKKLITKNTIQTLAKVEDVKYWGNAIQTTFLVNKTQLNSTISKKLKKSETKELLYNEKKNVYYDPESLTITKTRNLIISLIAVIILTIVAIIFERSIFIEETEILISFRFVNLMLLILIFIGGRVFQYYFNKKNLIEVCATTKSKAVQKGNEVVKQESEDFEIEFEGEKIIYTPLNPPTGENFDEVVRTLYFKKDGTLVTDKAELPFLTVFTIIWSIFYLVGIISIIFYII